MKRGLSKDAFLQRLAQVPMFRALSKQDLRRLGRHANLVTVDEGRQLTVEGKTGYEFFVIAEGTAIVRRKNRKVATLGPGDFFGELALLDNIPRTATVVADSSMSLYVLDRRDFSAVLREVPEVAIKLLRGLARRLAEADTSLH